ncbi:Hsp70 family protein [Daejeonella sp.]|uniref:Hsp70 family protein n=1 Tax=Daejeonella sp. TaxID=2805397 RepID=UPI002731723D|nr:Hsp70 family protein [Daejeonella sp.]MDP2414818.1 Hsp70 family protein [Daejeonella sp.]
MARTKIDYGIDLGTTNSAISRIENGKPVIKKTDTLKDTMPSCINFNRKQSIVAGDGAANAFRSDKLKALKTLQADTNTYIEFKRTMGTDKKYSSSNMSRDYTSEELSAEVLKKLKSFITDEELKSVIVTVPAKFTINQKDATSRAAKLAGFEHCELLQEPIAASMAYGLDAKSKDGLWLVFDFGGGTFDAALLKVEDGIMKVIDTEGDNYLGGKNIDFAIVDDILIPHLGEKFSINSFIEQGDKKEYFREALKVFAEKAKIDLSFANSSHSLSDPDDFPEDDKGVEIELDIKITEEILSPVISPIFQKAIDICKELLQRNSLVGKNIGALILVGGPTYSPILRRMLKEQITDKVDTSIDPMTAVAEGAALFASTINVSEELVEQNRDRTKIQLGLGYEPTTVEMEQFITVKILKDKTEGNIPDKVYAMIARSDKAWDSGKVQIDEAGEVIEIKLNAGKANSFNVFVYNEKGDLLPSEPTEFLIIQGSKIGSATLPYHIGIEIKSRASNKLIFRSIKGLEKNQSQPATGIANDLKTQKDLRPGLKGDFIKVPVYEAENDANGSRSIYNQHVFNAIITGEDLPKLLPSGSSVELTVKVKDGRISLSAYFPILEYSHEIEYESKNQEDIDADWLETEIAKAKQSLNIIKNEGGTTSKDELTKINSEVAELEKLLEQGRSDYDRKKQVLDNLRRSLRKIDDLQDAAEFPKTEEELKNSFYRLEETFKKVEGRVEGINDEGVKAAIAQFKEQIPQVIKEKNVKVAKELIDQMRALDFMLVDAAMGAQMEIQILKEFNDEFDLNEWSDRSKAKMLIQQGLSIAATTPTKQRLRPIVMELYKLLPKSDKPIFAGDDSVLTD